MDLKDRPDSTEFETNNSYQVPTSVSRATDLSHYFVACE
jgi:hypothetical protein